MPHILDLKKLNSGAGYGEAVPGNSQKNALPPSGPRPENIQEKNRDYAVYFSWEADEYDHFAKGAAWFFVLGLAAAVLTALAFVTANYFFAIFIMLAGILVGWFARKEPKRVHFAITSEGVQIGDRLYLFEDLRSFWILNDPPLFKELSLRSKKTFMPYIRLPLGMAEHEKIRDALLGLLPEEKQKESLTSLIARALKF